MVEDTKYVMPPKDIIKRALVKIQQKANSQFYFYSLARLQIVENSAMPTMGFFWKDLKIEYSPQFVLDITDKHKDNYWGTRKVEACLIHELMHCLLHSNMRFLMYFGRINKSPENNNEWISKPENMQKFEDWNVASDIVINALITLDGYELPEGTLKPESTRDGLFTPLVKGTNIGIDNPHKLSTEEVYEMIQKLGMSGKSNGTKNHYITWVDPEGSKYGDSKKTKIGNMEIDTISKGRAQELDKELKDILDKAISKTRGVTPRGMDYILEKSESVMDWRALLEQNVTGFLPHNQTYTRPSNTSLALFNSGVEIFLPRTLREFLEIGVAIDTSGSCNDYVKNFKAEVLEIFKRFPNIRMVLMDCDTMVYQTLEIDSSTQDIAENWVPKGGGGTDFRDVFEKMSKEFGNLRLMVFLTDGEGTFPEKPPDFHTMWVVVPNGIPNNQFPFGEVVRMPRIED